MRIHTGRAVLALIAVLLMLGGVFALQTATANAADEHVTGQQRPPTQWNDCVYIVRYGDTLFSIGMRYGVSPYYLAQINGLWNPNYIFAGMPLRVPCNGSYPPNYPPKHPKRPPAPPIVCGQETKYLVRPGDNLFRIALTYGTTVEALRDANDLWGKVLRPGSTLIIPCPLPEKEAPVREATVKPRAPELAGTPQPEGQATTEPNAQPTPAGQATPPAAPVTPTALPPEPSATVTIGETVEPTVAEIKPGQSIVFINDTGAAATILSGFPGSPNGLFTSGELPPGGTWVYVFDTLGSYTYYVMENTGLAGQVNVTP